MWVAMHVLPFPDPKYQGSTPAAAMVKWLMSNENLTATVIATKNLRLPTDLHQERSDSKPFWA